MIPDRVGTVIESSVCALWTHPRKTGAAHREWAPHRVYVIHIDSERLFKVGMASLRSQRLDRLISRDRVLVDLEVVANWHLARLLEATTLLMHAGQAKLSKSLGSLHGAHECWRDVRKPVALATLERDLWEFYGRPRAWNYSEDPRFDPRADRRV